MTMKKYILLSISLLLGLSSLKGQELNRVVVDSTLKKEVLIGYCDREGLFKLPEFATPFLNEYNVYEPNHTFIQGISENIRDVEIIVVLGTWCDDSRDQVPRLFKVLEVSGYEPERVRWIAVDRQKKAPETEVPTLNIERVPTIILMRGGKELGRIIETPIASIEEDLLRILQGTQSDHDGGDGYDH